MPRAVRTEEEIKEALLKQQIDRNAGDLHKILMKLLQDVVNVEPVILSKTCDRVNEMVSEDLLAHDIRNLDGCKNGDECPYENGRYAYFMREVVRIIQEQNKDVSP